MSDPEYTGPPASDPPPRGWQVPQVIAVAPPRVLPTQDRERMHAERRRARTITQGVAILSGSMVFVILMVLLVRAIT
ncbi:hypothetical protein LX16_3646 [Stackebrandtia albiflava]|uniref:Uncharacterized protein n=1 Tax=Stackebrandtia albiflava TaxID=406432 RepID=A0A562V4R3_9ACTN|nr:hypothetical protein [Stackebrandtia albiflava]TWJ12879.1 hypothetical protein LX16_3646 [Stackebrandtia albiflava]